MFTTILEHVGGWIASVIEAWGYGGVVLLMAIESMCIPLPSELIMPFAGFLVYQGKMSLWGAGLAGGVGCVAGSLVAYWVGKYGGRPVIEKYGKYIFMSQHDLAVADKWFAKYGENTSFWSRLLPVIRTFISLPLGIAKMRLDKFILFSFVGSVIWSVFLAWLGFKLGENWSSLRDYFHKFDLLIGFGLIGGVGWYIWRHIKNSKK
ncbi:MAG TPA: DedA family protein [bacterium]|nr:DedA family protein [bacterium]HPN67497.1 DedA family protein [bacterium]